MSRIVFTFFFLLELHAGICDNRQKATIATHDLAKILPPPETYATKLAAAKAGQAAPAPQEVQAPPPKIVNFDGRVPTKIKIVPLGRSSVVTAMQLYRSLNEEADQYRKEKKRNTISGIHKYLHLLKGKQLYPVLLDHTKEKVISLPPLTNADYTKVCVNTFLFHFNCNNVILLLRSLQTQLMSWSK